MVFGTSPYATGATMPELSTWLAGDGAFKPEHYKQGVATASNFDAPAVADGMQLQQDLMWKHRVAPTPAERTALAGLGNLFNVGRQAMTITSAIPTASAITAFKWGAAAVPRYKDNKVGVYIQPWMIAEAAKNREGGWAVLKYMASEAGQRAWYQITSQSPASKVVHQEWLKSVEAFVPAGGPGQAQRRRRPPQPARGQPRLRQLGQDPDRLRRRGERRPGQHPDPPRLRHPRQAQDGRRDRGGEAAGRGQARQQVAAMPRAVRGAQGRP